MKRKLLGSLVLLLALCGSLCGQVVTPIVAGVVTADVSRYNNFKIIVDQTVTSVVLRSLATPAPGQLVTLFFTENATGGFSVAFGGNVSNACTVTTTASTTTACQFQYDATANTWVGVGGSSSGSGLPAGGSVGNTVVNTAPGAGTWQNIQNISGLCTASQGCTGVASPTAHGTPQAEGASAYTFVGPGKNGQVFQANNAADGSFNSVGLPDGNGGAVITSTPYVIKCDTATDAGGPTTDRGTTLRFQAGASVITAPDQAAAGCGGNFPVILINDGAGTLTVNRSGTGTFTVTDGSTNTDGATSFTFGTGQSVNLNNGSGTVWEARITKGASLPASAKVIGSNGSGAGITALQTDVNSIGYAAGGGTAQAQTVTLAPAITALGDGLLVCWKPTAANTAPAPTLAVNGLTATTITKLGATPLAANDLKTTAIACAEYQLQRSPLRVTKSSRRRLCK